MRTWIYGLLIAVVCLPAMAIAQTASLDSILSGNGQQYCREQWTGAELRLYQACLQEQREGRQRIQALQSRYAFRSFYSDIAVPYCSSIQGAGTPLNLVEFSFCLNDEVAGYEAVQDLQRRYGSYRVASAARQAIASSGSWAATASLLKRDAGLKTIRSGGAS